MSSSAYNVVSLFSGCGGMDLGFSHGFTYTGETYEALPFHVVWANDRIASLWMYITIISAQLMSRRM